MIFCNVAGFLSSLIDDGKLKLREHAGILAARACGLAYNTYRYFLGGKKALPEPGSKERPVNYGRFLMAVLQVTVTCFIGETRAQATRCVRVDGELQVVCLHGHGCTL